MTNKADFVTACEMADIPPTNRQASKFQRQAGAAFKAFSPVKVERDRKAARNERDRQRRAEKRAKAATA